MGLIKVSRNGSRAYALPPRAGQPEKSGDQRLAAIMRDLPMEFRAAGLILVIKAAPGSAHPIAAALDRTGWPELAGSIAGDDTVFVACTDRAALDRLHKRLVRLAELADS
jgi:transcriptional regulator of arginine metabolism